MSAPDVVVIGGGVMGAAVAYHLAARGTSGVLVLQRDALGSGSTSKNAGGLRELFSTEINVQLSQRSLSRFEQFEDEFGIDIQFHRVGYLFLITEERDVQPFEASMQLWSRMGVSVEKLDRQQVRSVFPELVADDLHFAVLNSRAGHADPTSILNGFVKGARAKGARFREDAPVTGIDVEHGRVTGVRVGDERIPCGTVVITAGAWSNEVGRMAGVDLPIRPLRRQMFVTDAVPEIAHPVPLTIEFSTSFYFHGESGGLLLGMADPADGPGFREDVNWEFLPTVAERAVARLPFLEQTGIRTGIAGLYEDTPDKHPILGRVEGVGGLIVAAGFSGHGLQHAPATGELVAELMLDGQTSLDITPLRLERFARGESELEYGVV